MNSWMLLDLPLGGLFIASLASLFLGTSCGLIGSFVVARRMAMIGDVISHSILPGVAVAFIYYDKSPLIVFFCAVFASLLSILLVYSLLLTTRLKQDAVLAIVLSTFFALGVALISRSHSAGIQQFLYGQISIIAMEDLRLLISISSFSLCFIFFLWRPLFVSSFDSSFSRCLKYPIFFLEGLFYILVAVITVIAVQAVGVILVSALLIIPTAISYLLVKRFAVLAILSAFLGGVSALLGCLLSFSIRGIPSGPVIVLVLSLFFILVVCFFSPKSLLKRGVRNQKLKKRFKNEDALKAIHRFSEENKQKPYLIQDFLNDGFSLSVLKKLSQKGVVQIKEGVLEFTPLGKKQALSVIHKHRIWELYLNQKAGYDVDHVHDDAEAVEHLLKEKDVEELLKDLNYPLEDPHGKKIHLE